MIDLAAAFQGVTTPLPELTAQIETLGWELGKVSFGQGTFTAVAKAPHGEKVTRTGPTDKTAVANVLLAIIRKHKVRSAAQHYGGMWAANWTDKLPQIAEAYAKAAVYDPKAASAWKELAQDSVARHKVLEGQLTIKVVPDPEPYASAKEMADDIHKNQNFLVSNAHCEHPVWSVDENVSFRVVHDVLGHAVSGGDFGWLGENLACAAHFPLLSETAQQALFVECFTGDTLVRTETGYRPIKDIVVGDRVLTGDGTYRPVHNTFEREHEGEIVELETASSLGPIRVTAEHPFLAIVGDHPRKTKHLSCNPTNCNTDFHRFDWVEAGDIEVGSYVKTMMETDCRTLERIDAPLAPNARLASRKGATSFVVDDEFLWVVGMYLAEGSAGSGRLSFGLHKDETRYLEGLQSWFERHGYKTAVRTVSENGIELIVNSTTLAYWWPQWLGKGCDQKSIPTDLLNLRATELMPLVQGVMDGDGYYKDNVLYQTSPMLALQMAEICFRLGGQPSIIVRPQEGKRTVYELREASFEHMIARRRGRRGHWRLPEGNAVKVTSVNRIPFSGKVYDLGVGGEQTFVVHNVVVHNCIMQTGYAAYYRSFGPQKVFLPDEELFLTTQRQENPDGHTGVHPSQSIAPVSMPTLDASPEPEGIMEKGFAAPHMEGSPVPGTFAGRLAGLKLAMLDPNHGWESGHTPPKGGNAYTDMQVDTAEGKKTDPLDSQAVMDNASLIDSKWHTWVKEDGSPDRDKMKHAIVNAFRVVLLSPRKDLRWNAVHYQDISHIPGDELDPAVYWDALETARQNWNVKHRDESQRYAHLPFKQLLPKMAGVVFTHWPSLTMDQVHTEVNKLIYEWRVEEEHQVMQADQDKSENKQKSANDVENKVNKNLTSRIELFIDEYKPDLDISTEEEETGTLEQRHKDWLQNYRVRDSAKKPKMWKPEKPKVPMPGEEGMSLDIPIVEKEAPAQEQKYGAFMGTHLNAIAQVSEHSENILDAALADVQAHDATGHHFRSIVLQIGISGVGPKVCSFAWLLLMPTKSQLGTIDTHMMDVLGHNYEKEMSTRDYFKFERELQAGRDASGYSHVPLGAFQWGMWDYKRTGPGTHQDHSAMAVHNPTDHNMIDWQAKTDATQTAKADWIKNAPWWWKQTEEARNATSDEFNAQIKTPQNKVPFKVESMTKRAEAKDPTLPIPWLLDGKDNVRTGKPGQTYARFLSENGIPAHTLWAIPEHAIGRYHPKGAFVEVANGAIDQSIYDHIREILGPYNQPAPAV